MAETEYKFETIESGQTVTDFIEQINNNFNFLKNNKHITIDKRAPDNDAGSNGDIWIVYEE